VADDTTALPRAITSSLVQVQLTTEYTQLSLKISTSTSCTANYVDKIMTQQMCCASE